MSLKIILLKSLPHLLAANELNISLFRWLPDNEDMQEALDSMVGNAYLYGREWIASKVGID